MASLEEIMAGLFGDVDARGAQGLDGRGAPGADDRDPRRRRAGQGSGFGGIAGGEVTLASILPHLQGLRSYDYSGPNIRGLADLLPAMQDFGGFSGPVQRHLQSQGGDFSLPPGLADMPELPPGVDTRNPVGGPNVAPGNVDNGLALGQAPGIPSFARGNAPQTQGWRNTAPGYSAAASLGYGTPEFEQRLGAAGLGGITGGRGQGGPGAAGGVSAGGGGQGKGVGGGPTPVQAGGPAEPAPSAGGAGKPGAPAASGGLAGPAAGYGKTPSASKGTGGPANLKGPGSGNGKTPSASKGTGGPISPTGKGPGKGAPVPKGPGSGNGKTPSASKGTGGPTSPTGKGPGKSGATVTPVPGKTPSVSKGTGGPTSPPPAPKTAPKPAPGPGKVTAKKQQL